ncbi:MAG: alkaline phosphatase [Amphritea sp.]
MFIRTKRVAACLLLSLAMALPVYAESKIKNVILIIGDGMGPQQVGLLETYAKLAPNSIYDGRQTAISTFANAGVVGSSLTHPDGALVVDSACSATQLALGKYAPSEVIGVDTNGNPQQTVLELAKAQGKATGLVSDTRLTHATPAAFAAHQPHRSLENEIAVDMLEVGPDVMLSGGLRHWIPSSVNAKGSDYDELHAMTGGTVKLKSKRKDERNLLAEAQSSGYQLAFNRQQLSEASDQDKLLGLFSYSGMQDGIQNSNSRDDANRTEPTLTEMTAKALEVLSKDEDGFFLMVEGGQIDWAGHNNDTGTMLHEMIKFDNAVRYVHDWVDGREDTLVIITADHETGSFGFSYSAADLPMAKPLSGSAFSKQDYKPNFNFGGLDLLDRLYEQKKSFPGMMADFWKLPESKQVPEALADAINSSSSFKVNNEQAAKVLAMTDNPFKVEDHSYLSAKQLPKVDDFQAFYVYGEEIHYDLIGRQLAQDQNVVWGTGTHTHTPVNVIAWGPDDVIRPMSSFMHHKDIGAFMMSMMK